MNNPLKKILIGVFLTTISISSLQSQCIEGLPCIYKNYNICSIISVDSLNRDALLSDDKLDSILVQASSYFQPICMSMSSCETVVMENDYSLGIISQAPIPIEKRLDELRNRFSRRKRINIFFLSEIQSETCGESTFDGITTLYNANIFVDLSCEDGPAEQIAHHLGHLFGLRDTYDSETLELVNGSNCATAGDRICDTPADPFGQEYLSPADSIRLESKELVGEYLGGDCRFIYEYRDPNDEFYCPLVTNIMSAYNCKCSFTREQLLFIANKFSSIEMRHY